MNRPFLAVLGSDLGGVWLFKGALSAPCGRLVNGPFLAVLGPDSGGVWLFRIHCRRPSFFFVQARLRYGFCPPTAAITKNMMSCNFCIRCFRSIHLFSIRSQHHCKAEFGTRQALNLVSMQRSTKPSWAIWASAEDRKATPLWPLGSQKPVIQVIHVVTFLAPLANNLSDLRIVAHAHPTLLPLLWGSAAWAVALNVSYSSFLVTHDIRRTSVWWHHDWLPTTWCWPRSCDGFGSACGIWDATWRMVGSTWLPPLIKKIT